MISTKISRIFTVVALFYSLNEIPLVHAAEFKLLKAIRLNDTEEALKLINKKKKPWFFKKKIPLKERLDRKDQSGDSALISAAWIGNSIIVETLLQNGASVDIQDNSGNTALHWAATQGHLSVAKRLLSFKASLEIQNRNSSTALTTAIINKKDEIAKYLIHKSANPNARYINDVPALSLAIKGEKIDLFWDLIRAHAEINAEDLQGNTPLNYAISQRNAQAAKWLLLNGGYFGRGPRPSAEGVAWFQEVLLNYLSKLTDPTLVQPTVAQYLYLSKVEGWLGSPFHSQFIQQVRMERLQNMEVQVQDLKDRAGLPHCVLCGRESAQSYERNMGPANCACFLCPKCTVSFIHKRMLERGSDLIVCPGPNCYEEITQSFLSRQKFPQQTVEDFRIYQAKKKFEQSPNWFSCPTLNCPSGASTIELYSFDCDLCGISLRFN